MLVKTSLPCYCFQNSDCGLKLPLIADFVCNFFKRISKFFRAYLLTEIKDLPHLYLKAFRNPYEHIKSRIGHSSLDITEINGIYIHPFGKGLLGQLSTLP